MFQKEEALAVLQPHREMIEVGTVIDGDSGMSCSIRQFTDDLLDEVIVEPEVIPALIVALQKVHKEIGGA